MVVWSGGRLNKPDLRTIDAGTKYRQADGAVEEDYPMLFAVITAQRLAGIGSFILKKFYLLISQGRITVQPATVPVT